MLHRFSRTELLIGKDGLDKLAGTKVAVFGVGGVGSYAVEALARAGIGGLVLIDHDDVCLTNINRQMHALQSTVGQPKVDLMKKRVLEINPDIKVEAIQEFYSPDNGDILLDKGLDYVIDAIDNVTGKIDLAVRCRERDLPIVCAMGAGNKLDPTGFQVADISKTSVDPLARVIRRELRKRGITKGVKVVYSKEQPVEQKTIEAYSTTAEENVGSVSKKPVPGSISFVPPVAGLILAGEVIRDLLEISRE